MIIAKRYEHNPILSPDRINEWENLATFNGSVVKQDNTYHMLYRALSEAVLIEDNTLELSTIGYAQSHNGRDFHKRRQFITPTEEWEKYGCEDPRITFFEGKYYVFYTALSSFPFGPEGIKIALATTSDFNTVEEKKLITPFNAKAGTLFPERINGKIAMLLTANTDQPPAQIGIALFDNEEQMGSQEFWDDWYENLSDHALNLKRLDSDHVEIGAQPIKTDQGWLLVYSHIRNYFSDNKIFGIEAVLLDLDDPKKIIGRTQTPFLVPDEEYELYGIVPNIAFPSGALIEGDTVMVYYGGADTRVCLATLSLSELLEEMTKGNQPIIISKEKTYLERFEGNPILAPIEENEWEKVGVFNPAAILLDNKVHILYRAFSGNNISTIGYAVSEDGYTISERLDEPIYVPRASFEKNSSGSNYGCEDQRITQIDDRLYITYTAYDGVNVPKVALSSISVNDFLNRKWDAWNSPITISPPGVDDKNTAILPEKVNGKYMVFHRIDLRIWVDFVDNLAFAHDSYIQGFPWLTPREGKWDSVKIGISAPPIKTEKGWLFTYHGISEEDYAYRVGVLLLDLEDPTKIISRIDDPILEPIMQYEREGYIPNVVFPCGAVVKDGRFFLYYGGADTVVGVASCDLNELLNKF